MAPKGIEYEHDKIWHDGNGHSHVRASLIGPRLIYEHIDDAVIRKNVLAFEKTKDNDIKSANIEKKDDIKEIYVAVSDSGKGISPDILPRLFEKFNSNSDTGTGLGLYISKKLIEAMGGRIWAFNNADGRGSTFVFSIPKFDSYKL